MLRNYASSMAKSFFNFIGFEIKRKKRETLPEWMSNLDKIGKVVKEEEGGSNKTDLKIMIGPSFCIHAPCFVLDRLLSYSLRLRGAEVIPIYCDGVQETECNYYGGSWGGGEQFKKNCRHCIKTSQKLWKDHPSDALTFSKYITPEEKKNIKEEVAALQFDHVFTYERDELPFGQWAKDILVNNDLVGDFKLVHEYDRLGRIHLSNLLMIEMVYTRILDQVKPDRVISNDSYYGMWALLQKLCEQRTIAYYSHWPQNLYRTAFAYNDAAMNLNFSMSWDEFQKKPLSIEEEQRIEKWLSGERGLAIDTTKLQGHENEDFNQAQLDPHKPTAVLAANVIWDLAALNKQIIFKDMMDWVIETIKWFNDHPNFQLIVKPHPAETAPSIPKTKESVKFAIESAGIPIPDNVLVLSPNSKVTLNDLPRLANVKVALVHTSTVGFEWAARGMPVVTTGRSPYRGFGFTHDPVLEKEYFDLIERSLADQINLDKGKISELAKKFTFFYHFHYFSNLGLFQGNPPVLSENIDEVLFNAKSSAWQYILDSIINGLPICDEKRWIPQT